MSDEHHFYGKSYNHSIPTNSYSYDQYGSNHYNDQIRTHNNYVNGFSSNCLYQNHPQNSNFQQAQYSRQQS